MVQNKPALLLSSEKVASEFNNITAELDKFDAISNSVKIDSDETLAIAENNAAQVKTLLDNTEKVRKQLKKPYYETSKLIDDFAKTITERLTAFKQRYALAITNWKSVQAAAKNAEIEKKKRELEEIEKQKKKEADRLGRLANTIYAKLYGGVYQSPSGEKLAEGCNSKEDCAQLEVLIETKFPPASEFIYFKDHREEILRKAKKALKDHMIDLIDLQSSHEEIRKVAKARILHHRQEAGLVVVNEMDALSKKIKRDTKKELKDDLKELQETTKGMRRVVNFKVINEEQVTREFLSVDESKIRKFMEGQTDKIKEQIKKGEQPLSGVHFYVEEIHVSR